MFFRLKKFFKRKTLFIFVFLSFHAIIFSEGFVEGTLVKTKNGYVAIENLKKNDLVYSLDFKNSSLVDGKISKIYKKKIKELIQISIESEKILTAYDHKFYSPLNERYKWVKSIDLKPGEFILKNVTTLLKIINLKKIERETFVYCISIENYQNYFISKQDILVHNVLFSIPLFTWVIGKGITWFGGSKLIAAASTVIAGAFILKKNIQKNNEEENYPSINQVQKLIEKKQVPKSIKRADRGGTPQDPQDHIHFKDKSALRRDGKWKHSKKVLTNSEKYFLKKIGFKIPK